MTRTVFPDVIFGWRSRANRDHYRTTALGVTAGPRAPIRYFSSRNLPFAKETFLGLFASALACTFCLRSSSIRSYMRMASELPAAAPVGFLLILLSFDSLALAVLSSDQNSPRLTKNALGG